MSSCVDFSKKLSLNFSGLSLSSERSSSPHRPKRFGIAPLSEPVITVRKGMKERVLFKMKFHQVISCVEDLILGFNEIENSDEIMQLKEMKNELLSSDKFNPKNIENLAVLAENLLGMNEKEKTVTVLRLAIDLMSQLTLDPKSKILGLQNISSIFFRAEDSKTSFALLKQASKFVEALSTIEDQLEVCQNLAIDFFFLGDDVEVIHLMNHIARASYFSFNQRLLVFQKIFEFMLDNDKDLMFSIIERTESSLEKDISLRQLVSWILEDVENKDRLSHAFQAAGLIQDLQTKTEVLNGI